MRRIELFRWLREPFGKVLAGLLSLVLFGSAVGVAYALASPTYFAPFNEPIGVAATTDKLLVTNYCGNPRTVSLIDSAGHSSVFAHLPDWPDGGCHEDYIAASPGLGGFPASDLYVMQGPNVVHVSADGTTVTHFATIPGLPPTHNGIAFDQVGTFGNDMIVTGSNGTVWRVNSSGTPTFVANVGTQLEGPIVAPASFAPYGGQILAAAENASRVYAISNTGVVSVAAVVPAAESVHLIPNTVCSYGASGGAFFSAMYPTHIEKFAASDFVGLGGQVLVTSEAGGTYLLKSVGGTLQQSQFEGNNGQHEGSAFVDCAVPPTICTPDPSAGFGAPLSATMPYNMHMGESVPIRFTYGSCSQPWIHDESVLVMVVDTANPDSAVTAWVYGYSIAIDDVNHLYTVNFDSSQYNLTAGHQLQVQVFIGDNFAGMATINVTP